MKYKLVKKNKQLFNLIRIVMMKVMLHNYNKGIIQSIFEK